MWIGFLSDFLSLIDEFDEFMKFLKFLRREKTLREQIPIDTFSLDVAAYYLQNNHSFCKVERLFLCSSSCPDYGLHSRLTK